MGTSMSMQLPKIHPGCVQVKSFCPILFSVSILQQILQIDFLLLLHQCQTVVYYCVQIPRDQMHTRSYLHKDLQSSGPKVQHLLQTHGGEQVEYSVKDSERMLASIFYFHWIGRHIAYCMHMRYLEKEKCKILLFKPLYPTASYMRNKGQIIRIRQRQLSPVSIKHHSAQLEGTVAAKTAQLYEACVLLLCFFVISIPH